jgi:uncharacterized protein (DUF302 family)
MRRALPGALALGVAVVLAAGADRAAAQASRVERTPHLFVVRVPGAFEDVLASLLEEIKRRNYAVTGVNHLDDVLARRAAELGGAPLDYEGYKVVGFCNLSLADRAIRQDPHVGALMPCRAVVFRPRGVPETTIAAFRPSFLAGALELQGMDRLLGDVVADLLAILTRLAGE